MTFDLTSKIKDLASDTYNPAGHNERFRRGIRFVRPEPPRDREANLAADDNDNPFFFLHLLHDLAANFTADDDNSAYTEQKYPARHPLDEYTIRLRRETRMEAKSVPVSKLPIPAAQYSFPS